uniref:Uncharacterized protein MANES_15G085900 n=1 Tax=Rhizophora mucronata TaxID=61149 RepID=A0A2P2LYR6_RHIMU
MVNHHLRCGWKGQSWRNFSKGHPWISTVREEGSPSFGRDWSLGQLRIINCRRHVRD